MFVMWQGHRWAEDLLDPSIHMPTLNPSCCLSPLLTDIAHMAGMIDGAPVALFICGPWSLAGKWTSVWEPHWHIRSSVCLIVRSPLLLVQNKMNKLCGGCCSSRQAACDNYIRCGAWQKGPGCWPENRQNNSALSVCVIPPKKCMRKTSHSFFRQWHILTFG